MAEEIYSPVVPKRPDGRQSQNAAAIARGTCRLLSALDHACLSEFTLANNRRADLICLSPKGAIWIVEIKSCPADFRTDRKWPEYREFCDRLFFGVAPDFPLAVLPVDAGIIIADRYGGEIARDAAEHKLGSARRKALTLRFAVNAADRLLRLHDPGIVLES